jgi:hypothetical protein
MVPPFPAEAPVMFPVIVPIVHANVLGALAVKMIFGPVALQIDAVDAVVTAGVGLTVTVAMMLKAEPTHPIDEVGVTKYSTVPDDVLLGLVSTWLITLPVPALAPVIPPVIVPNVQLNVLGVLATRAILVLAPLHILAAGGVDIAGIGLTVTVIVYGTPGQTPVTDAGVTMYSILPALALPGLVRVWLIVLPDPTLAPVIPPVMVPIVHVKVLVLVAARLILVVAPLQIVAFGAAVTTGVGLTVTVIV